MHKTKLVRLSALIMAAVIAASPAAVRASETDAGTAVTAEAPAPAEEPVSEPVSEPEPEEEPAKEPEPGPSEEPSGGTAEEPAPEPGPSAEGEGSEGGNTSPGEGAGTGDAETAAGSSTGQETGTDGSPAEAVTGDTSQQALPNEGDTAKDAEAVKQQEVKSEAPDKTVSINGKEYETKTPGKDESPEDEKQADAYTGSNADLIARQHIVNLPVIRDDFRFYHTDDAVCMYSSDKDVFVYEEMSEDSFKVGRLSVNGRVYVLKECGDGWVYGESGDVRGFVRGDALSDGPVTVEKCVVDMAAYFAARIRDRENADIRDAMQFVSETPEPSDAAVMLAPSYNSAYAYCRATVTDPVVEGSYGVALADIDIRDRKDTSGETVGTLKEGGLMQVLLDEGDWLYVESRDVRGFARKEDVRYGGDVDSEVEESGTGTYAKAEEKMDPKDNRALYYSMKSASAGSSSSDLRKAIVEKAASCIGNPYVWGGTSLTNGADCSGFVQAVYRCFGISLPRVACDQAEKGMQIPLDQAQPGDLVFFAKNGYVYHVAMIAGYNGETIEAYSSSYGIISHSTEGRSVVWCCNYID